MMPVVIDRVAAVGKRGPHRIGQELILRPIGPVAVTHRMSQVAADHFLQENHIGIDGTQAFTNLVYRHAPVEMRKPLMDVVGRHAQVEWHRGYIQWLSRRAGRSP